MAEDAVVAVMEHPRIEEEVEEDDDTVSVDMIHWLVTCAGCVAIWPVIVPAPVTRQ